METICGKDEFLPYIYSGYFIHFLKIGEMQTRWRFGMPDLVLDFAFFSVIIENDIFWQRGGEWT